MSTTHSPAASGGHPTATPSTSGGMIHVVGWHKFQHYKDRHPIWIKCYLELLDKDEYLELAARDRALLHGIWIATGRVGNDRVPADEASLRKRLRLRYTRLDNLLKRGFIEVRTSANGQTRVPLGSDYGPTTVRMEPTSGAPDPTSDAASSAASASGLLEQSKSRERERSCTEVEERRKVVAANGHGEIEERAEPSSAAVAIEHLLVTCNAVDDGRARTKLLVLLAAGASERDFWRADQHVREHWARLTNPIGRAICVVKGELDGRGVMAS